MSMLIELTTDHAQPWRIAFENQPGSGDVGALSYCEDNGVDPSKYTQPTKRCALDACVGAGFYLDILVDCSLGGDIFLNLRRFYFNKRTGLLITDSAKIRTKYLTSWFIIDALSIIPFDWVIMVIFPVRPAPPPPPPRPSGPTLRGLTLRLRRQDSGKAEDARSARMLRLTRMVCGTRQETTPPAQEPQARAAAEHDA
jgi:hypothetical protein